MNANTYVNNLTWNIIDKIDKEIQTKKSFHNRSASLKNNSGLSRMDTFSANENITSQFEMMTYQKSTIKVDIVKGFLPQEIVDKINNGLGYFVREGDVYMYDGVYFKIPSIPPLDGDKLPEVKAEDNVISFGQYDYFKYVSKDGKEYYFHTGGIFGPGFSGVETERMRGTVYDKQACQYIAFWNSMMTVTGPDLPGREYSQNEVASYLEEAGIRPGFFTVNMKGESRTLYYTQAKYSRMVETKEDYDNQYDNITRQTHFLSGYEPGSIFRINGKEYTLSENHTLDIPYGEDIFAMEYPRIPL